MKAMTSEQCKKQGKLVRDLADAYNNLTDYGRKQFAVFAPGGCVSGLGRLTYFAMKTGKRKSDDE